MEPTNKPNQKPSMDIATPVNSSGHHSSRKVVIVVSIVLVVLAAILIALQIKARNDYWKSPEGILQRLEESSRPLTKTPEDRQKDLEMLHAQSATVTATNQESLNALQVLEQQ